MQVAIVTMQHGQHLAIRSRIEEADASYTLTMLRCTEVSPPTVEMGQKEPT
jgi:hypothetical protein